VTRGGLDLGVLWNNLDYLLTGAIVTVRLSVVGLALAVMLGSVSGVVRLYAAQPFRAAAAVYVETFRGTPVLVQIFFVFFGLPLVLDFKVSAFVAVVVALSLNSGAYFSEIMRGGLQSIAADQWLGGRALGLGEWQVLRHIIIPQAIRRMIPPAIGQFTILVKDTSVASVVGLFELTKAGQHVVERTFASFEIFALVGVIYFIVCFLGSNLSRSLERRLERSYAWDMRP
jgi:His/Glu/Gln/Arg/opine family amino acid ABC transporter permease subunit